MFKVFTPNVVPTDLKIKKRYFRYLIYWNNFLTSFIEILIVPVHIISNNKYEHSVIIVVKQ